MMKQRQLDPRRQRPGQNGPHGSMLRHAVAALSVMGAAMALTVGFAQAEARPAHAKPRPVAEVARARASGAVGRSLAKNVYAKRGVATKGRHAAVAPAVAKTARGSRAGRRERDLPASPRRGRHEETVSKAMASRRAPFAPARRQPVAIAATAVDDPHPLTVDDFTRAAKGVDIPSVETDASAVDSHADSQPADGGLPASNAATAAKHGAAKRPVGVKSGVAAGAEMATLPMGNLLPDENVAPTLPAHESDDAPVPGGLLRAPTQRELAEEVEQPVLLPGLYRNGRLVVPAPLKGTHEILVHQNLVADDEGLERIQDEDDLRRLRAAHLLVNFPETASLRVNPELSAERRCARVWTVKFAGDISRAFYARFKQPLQVNSAVRTVAYQVRLQRINGNAAGTDGEAASPHLTGQAMDLGKRGMSMAQIAWMRAYLLPLMEAGKIDVEEEFQQACFHISVYRTYLPAVPAKRKAVPRNEIAQLRVPRVAKASPRVADEGR